MALGRTKIGRRQRAESPQQETAAPDRELESYLAALSPEEDVETTGSGRGFGAAQVYQLRLPLMANERLKELAAQQGTSPDALARDWVMQHLADADASVPAWPEGDAREPSRGHAREDNEFPPDRYSQDPYGGDQYAQDPYAPDPYGADPYGGDQYAPDPHAMEGYPADPYTAGVRPDRRRPGAQHRGNHQHQYSGQLYPAQGDPYGQDDPYRAGETDTEITIPGGQYRY